MWGVRSVHTGSDADRNFVVQARKAARVLRLFSAQTVSGGTSSLSPFPGLPKLRGVGGSKQVFGRQRYINRIPTQADGCGAGRCGVPVYSWIFPVAAGAHSLCWASWRKLPSPLFWRETCSLPSPWGCSFVNPIRVNGHRNLAVVGSRLVILF